MSKAWKVTAVLFVALPLWFIAWRHWEEWRVRSAFRWYVQECRSTPKDGAEIADRRAALKDFWQRHADSFHEYNLRSPDAWEW